MHAVIYAAKHTGKQEYSHISRHTVIQASTHITYRNTPDKETGKQAEWQTFIKAGRQS